MATLEQLRERYWREQDGMRCCTSCAFNPWDVKCHGGLGYEDGEPACPEWRSVRDELARLERERMGR